MADHAIIGFRSDVRVEAGMSTVATEWAALLAAVQVPHIVPVA
jgi:hypothetical protein